MLQIQDLRFSYSDFPTLRGITLQQASGEIICLLGPSGCGKTTLLRLIAGLEAGYEGSIRLAGRDIRAIPTHARDLGLMFQDYALFPHLNVAQNIAFGLRMRGHDAKAQQVRVMETLALVSLSGYEKRDVNSLSGGERQRVALARSLAPKPSLLMLDEPLGSLDAALRDRLALEIRRIIRSIRQTALYVTHDQQEAFAIADRIVLMDAGRIVQVGTPTQLYLNPETIFAAQFLGLENLISVQYLSEGVAHTALGDFSVEGNPTLLLLHPDGIRLDPSGPCTGEVADVIFRGDHYRVRMNCESVEIMLRVPVLEPMPERGSQARFSVQRVIALSETG